MLTVFSVTVGAQGFPTEFPADAVPVSADSLKTNVLGKKFVGKRADGKVLTMEFGADGSYRITAADGGMLDGKVRVEGDKLCQDMRKALESGCNDVRLKANLLFYKRNVNGEVVTYTAQ
jgi:hypothetical protein